MQQFIEKYRERINGALSGFDRLVFRGSLRRLNPVQGLPGSRQAGQRAVEEGFAGAAGEAENTGGLPARSVSGQESDSTRDRVRKRDSERAGMRHQHNWSRVPHSNTEASTSFAARAPVMCFINIRSIPKRAGC